MFWTAKDAVAYAEGAELKQKMDAVRRFCFAHGLLGPEAKNVDAIGIRYPDGSTQGDANAVKLRWDTSFMKRAAEGKIAHPASSGK